MALYYLYNVVAPCIVGGKHYTRPSAAPIEVSVAEAKPLVAAGVIEPVEAEPITEAKPHRARGKSQDGGDGKTE